MTITLPNHFRNLIRRIIGLKFGRYFIVLSVGNNKIDYTVRRIGPVEMSSRSLETLSPGRYIAILTVTVDGIADYTVQRMGKVEQ